MRRPLRYCRNVGVEVGSDAVVAHSPETTMSTTHDTNERRQAIWPWLLMPVLVLLVFYTLQSFRNQATRGAASQPQAQASAADNAGP